MRIMRGLAPLAIVLAAGLSAGLSAAPSPAAAEGARPIADLWYAHNAVAAMLGAGDRIKVTVSSPAAYPWLYRMTPALAGAEVVANGEPNVEALLAAGVGLAFVSNPALVAPLESAGIDVRNVSFTDRASMLAALDQTAAALGGDAARAEAADYAGYLDGVIARIAPRLADIPEERRPRVLHLASLDPMQADGSDTIVDEWIRLAGGRNAAEGLVGNLKPVSLEQVIAWAPDIVIVGASAAQPLPGAADGWEGLAAVRDGKVYRNPRGVFLWDRYSTEFALQLLWAAKLFAPDRFGDIDVAAEAGEFYGRFFDYRPTGAEIERILAALPPE